MSYVNRRVALEQDLLCSSWLTVLPLPVLCRAIDWWPPSLLACSGQASPEGLPSSAANGSNLPVDFTLLLPGLDIQQFQVKAARTSPVRPGSTPPGGQINLWAAVIVCTSLLGRSATRVANAECSSLEGRLCWSLFRTRLLRSPSARHTGSRWHRRQECRSPLWPLQASRPAACSCKRR